MTNMNNNNRAIELANQIAKLTEELQNLLSDSVEYKEEKQERKSYINTYQYHCMLVLRTAGIKLTYEEVCKFLEEAEDRSIDFDEKHPWSFTDEEIIENYFKYYVDYDSKMLSNILREINDLERQWVYVNNNYDDDEEKDIMLTDIDLAIDCLATSLMYGDYVNNTGKPYNYYLD